MSKTLFDNFVGEKCAIILNEKVLYYHEEHEQTFESNRVIEGFVLDVNEHFVLIGNKPTETTQLIHMSNIVRIAFYEETVGEMDDSCH